MRAVSEVRCEGAGRRCGDVSIDVSRIDGSQSVSVGGFKHVDHALIIRL